MAKATDNGDKTKKKNTKISVKKTAAAKKPKQPKKIVSKPKKSKINELQELDFSGDQTVSDPYNDLNADNLNTEPRDVFAMESDQELLSKITGVYQIWWNWAHFELSIVSPHIDSISPAVIILPETLHASDEIEFVYPITDYGNTLATSKGTDMYSVGMSMCKLFYTIEKIIFILIERLKQSGVNTETEIQIAFDGHQLAQRKAFESIINLSYNVVVTNFDPGVWGERYLDVVKRLADRGYGYPSETPRDIYRNPSRSSPGVKR